MILEKGKSESVLAAVDGGCVEGLAAAQLVVGIVCEEGPRHVEDGLQAGEGILQDVQVLRRGSHFRWR